MAKILVDTTNVHRDDVEFLRLNLEHQSWKTADLSIDELNGLKQLISYVINNRVNEDATDLSYMELLNLKNKLS